MECSKSSYNWEVYININFASCSLIYFCQIHTKLKGFFCDIGVWTQGLHLQPLHQPFFWVSRAVCLDCFQTPIFLISASWAAKIIGISHWSLATKLNFWCLPNNQVIPGLFRLLFVWHIFFRLSLNFCTYIFKLDFWWYWGLNSRLHACLTGAPLLVTWPSPIYLEIFFRYGLTFLRGIQWRIFTLPHSWSYRFMPPHQTCLLRFGLESWSVLFLPPE
jgi:hypothetical protein